MPPRSFATATLFFGLVLLCATLYHFWVYPYNLNPSPWRDTKENWLIERPVANTKQTQVGNVTKPTNPQIAPPPDSLDDIPLYPSIPPKLTIIAIWNPGHVHEDPIYLPNFFASVAANPSIDLLFIKYDKNEVGCDRLFAPHVPNVREVCLTSHEYWNLHMEFLCKRWGGCSKEERIRVLAKMRQRAGPDRVNSHFRPFRAAVFKKWIHPRTMIWGWCDMDTFMGDFERNFPWDIAGNFDFLFPGPTYDNDNILLYFPGHLAFFQNAPHVVDEFMRFPNFRSMGDFMDLPWVGIDTEESEYSHWALTQTRLTFLRFPGIVQSDYHLSTALGGVFAIENPGYWNWSSRTLEAPHRAMRAAFSTALRKRREVPLRHSTFTNAGQEYVVQLREGKYEDFLWFPKKFATDFVVDTSKTRQRPYKRYLMRKPDGIVYDRTEPVQEMFMTIPQEAFTETIDPSASPMYAWDVLYNHFQTEKFKDWWKLPGLPPHAIAPDDVLYVDKEHGAYVWNADGEITFSALV